MIAYIKPKTTKCPRCAHKMLITGGSADKGKVAMYQMCAQCGWHQERVVSRVAGYDALAEMVGDEF